MAYMEIGSTLKGKNLLPRSRRLFRRDVKTIWAKLPPLKVYLFPLSVYIE